MSKPVICYLDDDETNLQLVISSLEQQFYVETLSESLGALEKIRAIKPELVILDVNMPDINGYEMCRLIRQDSDLSGLPVVFLTCLTTLKDRLEGYDAGGDAYLGKPFKIAELTSVIHVHLHRRHQLDVIQEQMLSAQDMAMTMMKTQSELGEVVQFSRNVSRANNIEAFTSTLFDTLARFGLESSIQINLLSGALHRRSDAGALTGMEQELFELSSGAGRITSFGNKCIYTSKHLVLLVKNVPLEDIELAGRLRDHLAIVVDSADVSLRLIEQDLQLKQKKIEVSGTSLNTINNEFDSILDRLKQMDSQAKQAFESLSLNIEMSFLYLGLTEQQEGQLLTLVKESREKADGYKEMSAHMFDSMQLIGEAVRKLSCE